MYAAKDTAGFTLIELMVVITLLAVTAAVAIPSFTSFVRNNRLQAQAAEVKTLLNYARGEAVVRRTPVTIKVNASAAWDVSYTLGGSQTVIRSMAHDPEKAALRVNTTQLVYQPNGTATAARITVCRNNTAAEGYLIEVKGSGSSVLYPKGTSNGSGTALASCTP
jgi:type IV fimbrial biogenesis protein FimU